MNTGDTMDEKDFSVRLAQLRKRTEKSKCRRLGRGADMVKLDVLRLLEEQGKTKYWLYKQLGMSYQNFSKMVNNQTKSIRYENIETMCLLLDCTPNDLFVITEE